MRNLKLILAGLVLMLVAGFWRLAHSSGELATDLLFGWIGFLRRVLPMVHVHWPSIWVFTVSLLAAIGLSHLLFRSFQRSRSQPGVTSTRWRISWTTAIVLSVVVMFAAGTSMIGAVHQIVWLKSSATPLFGRTVGRPGVLSKYYLQNLGMAVMNHASNFPADFADNPLPQSWVLPLLPFTAYMAIEVDQERPWNDPVNAHHFRRLFPDLLNSEFRNAPVRDAAGFGLNHYAGNVHALNGDKFKLPDDELQRSNLLLIGQVNANFAPWGEPGNCRDPELGFHSPDGFGGVPGKQGVLFLMADGSVKDLSLKTHPQILKAMSRP